MIRRIEFERMHWEAIARHVRENRVLRHNFAAEIGVRNGDTAEYLLREFSELRIDLVDPYLPYTDVGYFYTREQQDGIRERAFLRLAPFGHRVRWRVTPSVSGADEVEDGALDFAFIDADHSYAHVVADIAAWWPKVREGGWLMGHDFHMADVRRAVMEFAGERTVTHYDGNAQVWCVAKEEACSL